MMSAMKSRILYLEKNILKANETYYLSNDNSSIVGDKQYDAWVDELTVLDPKNRVLSIIGAEPVSVWNKVEHDVPMDSLNKVNSIEELKSWYYNECSCLDDELFISEKMDGISVSLKYEEGVLVQALTRGNGTIGEDISKNVLMMGVPKVLNKNYSGHVRGEIILLKSYHKEHFKDHANPRNAASGIARRLDGTGSNMLHIAAYHLGEHDSGIRTELDVFRNLAELGFDTPDYFVAKSLKDVEDVFKTYSDFRRDELDYEVDGLVVRINNLEKQISLGDKGRGPAGAVALKFSSKMAETTITDIVWQVGASGRLTPVAVFNPVSLAGANVSRASLYNYSYIEEIGVNIGSTVLVKRANDVIPAVDSVINPEKCLEEPTVCPDCGSKLSRLGEYIICRNKETCPNQVIGRISTWVAELGILEWGDKIIEKFVQAGLVKDVYDIYRLKESDISSLEGMGEKSAKALLKEIEKFREVTLYNLIGGLGIENVATTTAKLVISAGYDNLGKMFSATVDDLSKINGLGPIKSESFVSGLAANKDRVYKILESGVSLKAVATGALTGLSFCFTGKSSIPRAKLHNLVEENGGEVKKSVVKGLSYLVSPDSESNSSKSVAARKNGTAVISEDKFLQMIGGSNA